VKSWSAFIPYKFLPEWHKEPRKSLPQFVNLDTKIFVKRHFFLDESGYGFESLIHFTLQDINEVKCLKRLMPCRDQLPEDSTSQQRHDSDITKNEDFQEVVLIAETFILGTDGSWTRCGIAEKGQRPMTLPLLFDNSYRESEKRQNRRPWAFFQGRPSGKARLF
jgi:hypothetical protein